MNRFVSCSMVVGLVWCTSLPAQDGASKPALQGLDPIELCQGRAVAGQAEWTVAYGRYRYLFANQMNRVAFKKEPRRYCVQLAGACARMGPLSGAGSPDRYFIYDKRIYIFASDACRDTFKKNPSKYVDQPDEAPTGSEADREQGRRLIEAAVRGFGGADKVDAVKNVQTSLPRSYGSGKDKVDGELTTTIAFPDRLRHDESWGKWSGAHALSGVHSFEQSAKEKRFLEDVEREYLVRELFRHPLAIVQARRQPGFVAIVVGKGKVGDTVVDCVKAAVAGATTLLSIDPKTGRVLAVAYRGRPGIGTIGALEKSFDEFKAVDGVVLPHQVRTQWEGKLIPTYSGRFSAVRVSIALPDDFFRVADSK